MKYIDWVEKVLETMGRGSADPANLYGVNLDAIAKLLGFGRDAAHEHDEIMAIANAREDLYALNLLDASTIYKERFGRVVPYKPNTLGKGVLHDGLRSLWDSITAIRVSDLAQQFLGVVAERSPKESDQFADAEAISPDEITSVLGWSDDGGYALQQGLNDLTGDGLIAYYGHNVRITYKGAVWVEQNLAGWHKRWIPAEGSTVAAGGQGKVIKVVEREGTRVAALKELHTEHLRNTERRKRMRREVNILKKLDIDGVPKVYEHNLEDADKVGTPLYLITEWVEGETLHKLAANNALPLDRALTIARDAALILKACHDSEPQVLHRDIKADNIMADRETGKVHIVDFGIAWTKPDPGRPDLKTGIQDDLRNRWFSLPELHYGRAKQDPRTDITQLLGVLIFLLTGQAPRELRDGQNRPPHQALHDRLPRTTRLDGRWPRLEQVFDRGFQQNIDERFQSFDELLPILDSLLVTDVAPAEGDEARLYARWEGERGQLEEFMAESLATPPILVSDDFGFLNVFVVPVVSDPSTLDRTLNGEKEDALFAALLQEAGGNAVFPSLGNLFPDFGYPPGRQLRRTDGWQIWVKGYPRSVKKEERSPREVIDIELRDTGAGWLFCGRAAERADESHYFLQDDTVAGLTTRFLYAMGAFYGRAEYVGNVSLAVVITNLLGAESRKVRKGAGMISEPPPPYDRGEYRSTTLRRSALDLRSTEKCRALAEKLVMPLLTAVSQGQSNPFAE